MKQLVLTVSQLNTYTKSLLDSDQNLQSVYVTGEISNFTNHYRSGHLYLSLKDENALIRAVMFRSNAMRLRFTPENGMRVLCRGRVSLYDRDGQYQLYIEEMQPDGAGALSVAFEQLKARLQKEGLFDAAHKRPIPTYPERIAVITSPTGAAVQDIRNILGRRYPLAEMILCPVPVQGEGAAPQLIATLQKVEALQCADVIIIGRGGGSMEDLWAFNDEGLARAIYSCKIPVISAVGHETDFTICDFVADLRAPTPSAAAELAVPDALQLRAMLAGVQGVLGRALTKKWTECSVRLNNARSRPVLRRPATLIDTFRQRLDYAHRDLTRSADAIWNHRQQMLFQQMSRLRALDPLQVLQRGYAVAQKDGMVVKSIRQVQGADKITVHVSDGKIECMVSNTEQEDKSNGQSEL